MLLSEFFGTGTYCNARLVIKIVIKPAERLIIADNDSSKICFT